MSRAFLTAQLAVAALVCLPALDVSGQLVSSPNPMLGGNPQHSGFSPFPGPLEEPTILWEAAPGLRDAVFSVPAVFGEEGNLYVDYGNFPGGQSPEEQFYVSYSPEGQERWRFKVPIPSGKRGRGVGAVTSDGNIVVPFRDGVRSFVRTSGSDFVLNWEIPIGYYHSSPAVDREGFIYTGGTSFVGFLKLRPDTGAIEWEFPVLTWGKASSPALSNDESTVYISRSFEESGLYALRTADGELKWSFHPAPFTDASLAWASPTVGVDGTIYQREGSTGILYALTDNDDGFILQWEFDPKRPGEVSQVSRHVAVYDDTIYMTTSGPDPILFALDLDGNERWRYDVSGGGALTSTPLITEDAVYFGAQAAQTVHCVDRLSGELLWKKELGGDGLEFVPVALSDDRVLYVGTSGTFSHPDQAVLVALAVRHFRRGDSNSDGTVDLSDPIFTIAHLFQGGESPLCQRTADADDDGRLDLTDAIFLLTFLFQATEAPAAPGVKDCGPDGTPDELLTCKSYPLCTQ